MKSFNILCLDIDSCRVKGNCQSKNRVIYESYVENKLCFPSFCKKISQASLQSSWTTSKNELFEENFDKNFVLTTSLEIAKGVNERCHVEINGVAAEKADNLSSLLLLCELFWRVENSG